MPVNHGGRRVGLYSGLLLIFCKTSNKKILSIFANFGTASSSVLWRLQNWVCTAKCWGKIKNDLFSSMKLTEMHIFLKLRGLISKELSNSDCHLESIDL